jgi:hypothetical protein
MPEVTGLPTMTGLLDAVRVGVDAELQFRSSPPSLKDIVHRLRGSEFNATPRSMQNVKGFVQLDVPVGPEETGVPTHLISITLHLRGTTTGVVTTSQTSVWFNLQRILAESQPELMVPYRSYNGETNMVAFCGQQPSSLAKQIQLAGEAAVCARVVLEELFPEAEWVWKRAYPKVAELCWDSETEDSISSGRLIQQATLDGVTQVSRQSFRRGATDGRGVPTIFQERVQRGERFKTYGKAPGRLRAEVACPHRDAFSALVGRSSASFTVEGVKELLEAFVACASPSLAKLVEHNQQVLAGSVSVMPVLTALQPLLRIAAGEKGERGPRPSRASIELASQVIVELLNTAKCDLRGSRREHAVPHALEKMLKAGAVSRHESFLIYCLHPRLVRGAFELCHVDTVWNAGSASEA